MAGMTDLDAMLRTLTVARKPGEFVYVLTDDREDAHDLRAHAVIVEAEGVTAIIPRETADRVGLDYDYVAAWLTLEIHSSLEAVGLTAAFSRALGEAGISCNVLAGFHHDHILVPAERADEAVRVLLSLRD